MNQTGIVVLGTDSPAGTYILRIRVQTDLCMAFGRFKGGKVIALPAGDYVYVGSALGARGALTLAARLVRHATRGPGKRPHRIREQMLQLLEGAVLPKSGKKLYWNVDYLLDQMAAEITSVVAIRDERRLENAMARFLESEADITVIEKGLGANDFPGSTHLLRIETEADWWDSLPGRLEQRVFRGETENR